MAAWLYEGMLVFAVAFFATWLFSTLGQVRSGMDPRRPVLMGFLFLAFGVYFVWFWSRGHTLAMKTWHIGVVDARTGRAPSQARAALRYGLSWLWLLPPLAAIAPFQLRPGETTVVLIGWVLVWALLSRFNTQRQFVHDLLAGTRLVTRR